MLGPSPPSCHRPLRRSSTTTTVLQILSPSHNLEDSIQVTDTEFVKIVCRIIQLPPVEIKANDVCVKMLAAPINPSDINQIQGLKSHHLI
ncbi:putative trans-2-enoyl-CoA reductase (NADPH) [Helianthus debilis subsp. tardiflorus]